MLVSDDYYKGQCDQALIRGGRTSFKLLLVNYFFCTFNKCAFSRLLSTYVELAFECINLLFPGSTVTLKKHIV